MPSLLYSSSGKTSLAYFLYFYLLTYFPTISPCPLNAVEKSERISHGLQRETHRKDKSVLGVSLPSLFSEINHGCSGFTSLEYSWMSFRARGEGMCMVFSIVSPTCLIPIVGSCRHPRLILGALQNILVKLKSLLDHTSFWNLLKHQHILLVIKHQLEKHPKMRMCPELLLATSREPACPAENCCSQKAKESQGKAEIWEGAYIRGNTSSSHPRTCPLCVAARSCSWSWGSHEQPCICMNTVS